jgi:hypothetical protein
VHEITPLLKLSERAALLLTGAMAVPYVVVHCVDGTARAAVGKSVMRSESFSKAEMTVFKMVSFCSLLKLSERAALSQTGAMAVSYAEFNALHGTVGLVPNKCRMRKRHFSKPMTAWNSEGGGGPHWQCNKLFNLNRSMAVPYVTAHGLLNGERIIEIGSRVRKRHLSKPVHARITPTTCCTFAETF